MNEDKALETIYGILSQNFSIVEPRCLEELTSRIHHIDIKEKEIVFDTFVIKLINKEN